MRARVRNGIVVSLALHTLVLLALSRLAWRTPEPAAPLSPTATFVWLVASSSSAVPEPSETSTPFEPPPRVPPSPAVEKPPRPRAPARTATEQPAAGAQTGGASSPEDVRTRGPSPNPMEARRRAVEAVLEERDHAASYRSFAFPGTIGEQQAFDEDAAHRREEAGLQAPLTAFDSPSKGRAGLEEASVPGEHFRWISDDCYQDVGMRNPFLFVPLLTPTFCARPNPRGDLFAGAKPTYLMSAAERLATAKHVERIERLRRPTTGTPMPLEGAGHVPQSAAARLPNRSEPADAHPLR